MPVPLRFPPGRVAILGVVNVTPDSFSDGGDAEPALDKALRLMDEGADALDLGGESTRPGSEPVAAAEELARVLPVLKALRPRCRLPIAVDTAKAEVAAAALAEGADAVNDISALRLLPGYNAPEDTPARDAEAMADAVARHGATIVLMHMRGTPRTMGDIARGAATDVAGREDVVGEVIRFLRARVDYARSRGVDASRIWIDPGFGFGKKFVENAALLRRLDELGAVGPPILAGLSRKSMIGHALQLPAQRRMVASAALALMAAARGAAMVRVHDVQATAEALRMRAAILDA